MRSPPHFRLALALLFVCAFAREGRAAPVAAGDAATSFEALKHLAGEWTGTTPTGRTIGVTYKLIAADTVLVETWALGPGRVSMTVYHVDGDRLIATHYCPLGNQPRLILARHPGQGRLDFRFLDATGMKSPGDAHQDSFWIAMHGADAFTRSETYLENGKGAPEPIEFRRVPNAVAHGAGQ